MARKTSLYDKLYEELTGKPAPAKSGTAFEVLSNAAMSVIRKTTVMHDQHLAGESESGHQIDGLTADNEIIEAKDHTLQTGNNKVSLGEVQELQGVLTDIENVPRAFFASATDYTKPAIKYTDGTITNKRQTEIIPVDVTAITPEDEKGRIKTIVIDITAVYPDFDSGKFSICYAEQDEYRKVEQMALRNNGQIRIGFAHIFNADGSLQTTVYDLTLRQQPKIEDGQEEVRGQFKVDGYIRVEDELIHISGIDYIAPVVSLYTQEVITKSGEPKLVFRCKRLGVDTLITDEELIGAMRMNGDI